MATALPQTKHDEPCIKAEVPYISCSLVRNVSTLTCAESTGGAKRTVQDVNAVPDSQYLQPILRRRGRTYQQMLHATLSVRNPLVQWLA